MRVKVATARNWILTPDKFLGREEVETLRSHLERDRSCGLEFGDPRAVRNAAIIETLLGTGFRVSELCALVVGDLFLDGTNPQILVRCGKGGKRRLVPISCELAGYLVRYLEWRGNCGDNTGPESGVFSGRLGKITRSAIHRIWKAALDGAGLSTHWGVHSTRHSYGTEVYRRTKDLRLTQTLLGHSSPSTTMVYAHVVADDARRGVEVIWGPGTR